MNCAPRTPTRNPTSVFDSPADPDDTAGDGILRQAARRHRPAARSAAPIDSAM